MYKIEDYFEDARKHEEVFRNILRDVKRKLDLEEVEMKSWYQRIFSLKEMQEHEKIQKDKRLNPEAPLEEIFEKCSKGNRYGIWTILDFKVGPYETPQAKLLENEALFASEDIALLSGKGSLEKYKINKDNSVEFDSYISKWMS